MFGVKSFSPYISELKEKDPCHPLAHRGSSTVGEGHQEHHRGPGTMCLQHCSWGQLLKGKILLQEKEREHHVTLAGITFQRLQLLKPPNHSYPCSSTAPRCQHRSHPLPQWHQNPACFVRNGGGARAKNQERVLSNLMLIREAWKAARSRWLGTHDQMSTHFLETNIYK